MQTTFVDQLTIMQKENNSWLILTPEDSKRPLNIANKGLIDSKFSKSIEILDDSEI